MMTNRAGKLVLYGMCLAFLSAVAWSCCAGTAGERQTSPTPSIEIGKRVRLKDDTLVCLTKADLDELLKTAISKDELGFHDLVRRGRVFLTPKQTEVLVIDWDGSWNWFQGAVELRVQEGTYLGIAGWAVESALE